MKKIVLFLIFFPILLSARKPVFLFDYELETLYDSNILDYSAEARIEFENGENPEKYKIDTLDDLIISNRLETGLKHTLLLGHTQIDKLVLKYRKYLNNKIKDNGYIGFIIRQFLNRKFNFTCRYFYYPDIYIRHYKSVLDDEPVYREFSYSKNSYAFKLNWKLLPKLELDYELKFGQTFYNEYFTEYDASEMENEFGLDFKPMKNLDLHFSYTYKISEAQAGDAFEDAGSVSQIKDASCESDKYYFFLYLRNLIQFNRKPLQYLGSFSFEQKYFQSDIRDDNYHFGREDNKIILQNSLFYDLNRQIRLKLFYGYDLRNTFSPKSFVEDDKSYSTNTIGFELKYSY